MAAGNIDFAKVMAIVADFIVWLPALALLLQFLSDHHLLLESGLLLNSCMAALKTLQVSLSCPHGSQWNCHAWSSSDVLSFTSREELRVIILVSIRHQFSISKVLQSYCVYTIHHQILLEHMLGLGHGNHIQTCIVAEIGRLDLCHHNMMRNFSWWIKFQSLQENHALKGISYIRSKMNRVLETGFFPFHGLDVKYKKSHISSLILNLTLYLVKFNNFCILGWTFMPMN